MQTHYKKLKTKHYLPSAALQPVYAEHHAELEMATNRNETLQLQDVARNRSAMLD
jgi:hypothetical protein